MSRTVFYTVPGSFDGKKLFAFLRGDAQISSTLYGTLRHTPGSVTRNGEIIRSIDRIHTGDVIRVEFPKEETDLVPTPMPLDILYEDDDLLVLNKSGYIAMHPSHGHQEDTLANGVMHYFRSHQKEGVFHAVGRLDKGTSGVVICAKHAHASARVAATAKKTYIAVTDGIPPECGVVDVPIYRPDPDKTLRAAGKQGERAVTYYNVLQAKDGKGLVQLHLETGRTHQIRVHMAYLGTPLVGDSLYGTPIPGLDRHLLHCKEVSLVHPITGEALTFSAPFPTEFAQFL